MLTDRQEERLRSALGLLSDLAPTDAVVEVNHSDRRVRPVLTLLVAVSVVVAALVPLALLRDPIEESVPAGDVVDRSPGPAASASDIEEPTASFGDVSVVEASRGVVAARIRAIGDVLYAAVPRNPDRILSSHDGGKTWETVLSADPGDSEGVFGVGHLVVQAVADDTPVSDSVVSGSVVTEAPRVLVYDPTSGERWETTLPRPVDPPMSPIPLDGSVLGCALGGYQSWVTVKDVAVGPTIVVTGEHLLVGTLADGSTVCDGQVYRNLTWASTDGRTWVLVDSPPLFAPTWVGGDLVALSSSRGDVPHPPLDRIVRSVDGVTWENTVVTPMVLPEYARAIPGGFVEFGDALVAWHPVFGWLNEIPEVDDPEELRDVLGISRELSVQEALDAIGVDVPLDDAERAQLAAFVGQDTILGTFLAISRDQGRSWAGTYVELPITSLVVADRVLAGVTFSFSDPRDPETYRSTIVASADGAGWEEVVILPEPVGNMGAAAVVVPGAIMVITESGVLLEVPFS